MTCFLDEEVAEEVRLRYSGQEALTDGESATLVLPGPLSWWGWRQVHHS